MSEGGGGFSGRLFASNVTQVTVISGWNGSYGSMRPRGHVRHLAFGDRGHVKCAMGPKPSLELEVLVLFCLNSRCLRGIERHVLGLQCHSSSCNFKLEWFIWINGTWGACQTSRFGDGGPARCSMGPKQSLERVFFSLKSPFLRGVERHVLGLQCHSSDCNFSFELFI